MIVWFGVYCFVLCNNAEEFTSSFLFNTMRTNSDEHTRCLEFCTNTWKGDVSF